MPTAQKIPLQLLHPISNTPEWGKREVNEKASWKMYSWSTFTYFLGKGVFFHPTNLFHIFLIEIGTSLAKTNYVFSKFIWQLQNKRKHIANNEHYHDQPHSYISVICKFGGSFCVHISLLIQQLPYTSKNSTVAKFIYQDLDTTTCFVLQVIIKLEQCPVA